MLGSCEMVFHKGVNGQLGGEGFQGLVECAVGGVVAGIGLRITGTCWHTRLII